MSAPARGVDVCVIGGGPAGTGIASAARAEGAEVCLITAPRAGDGHLELVSGRARSALRQLGLLSTVVNSGIPCDGSVNRWESTDFIEHSSMLDPGGTGWIVARGRLDSALQAAVRQRGVALLRQRVTRVEKDRGRFCIRFGNGAVHADRVVLAVGARGCPGRDWVPRPPRHRLLALGVRLASTAVSGLGRRLLVDRAENGWWYALSDGITTAVVYCTAPSVIGAGQTGVRSAWRDACRGAADWLPPDVGRHHWIRPIAIGYVASEGLGGVRLAGDAAMSVDPLSGHGVTLAVEGAARYDDPAYSQWLTVTAQRYDARQHEIYCAASGFDGPFWAVRRG